MSDTLLENLVIWLPVVFVFVVTISILKENYKKCYNKYKFKPLEIILIDLTIFVGIFAILVFLVVILADNV